MFVSNRPGGCGGADTYITRFHPMNGWEAPVNPGCDVNSSADEAGSVLSFAVPGSPTFYFSSVRAAGPGGSNLYFSRMNDDWLFHPAELMPNVNSDLDDIQPYVRRDGREMVFASNRPDGQGFDVWSAGNETRPSLSWEGETLLFGTTRPGIEGVADIYYSTR